MVHWAHWGHWGMHPGLAHWHARSPPLRVLRQELMMNLKTPVSAPLVQAEKHRGVAGRSSFDHYYVLPLGAMQHGDQCRDASSSHMVVSANDSQRSEAALSLSSTGF